MPPPSISISAGSITDAPRITKRRPMPIIAAAFTVPVLATALAVPATALVIEHPQAADAYAVLGAILASLISLIEARYKGRDLRPALTNFLASASAGSFAPKIGFLCLVQLGTLTAESVIVKAWEVWAFAGFICGLNGWLVIHAASSALKGWLTKNNTDTNE
jgi:predicted membrane protein